MNQTFLVGAFFPPFAGDAPAAAPTPIPATAGRTLFFSAGGGLSRPFGGKRTLVIASVHFVAPFTTRVRMVASIPGGSDG